VPKQLETSITTMDANDLSEEDLERLLDNPEVQKTLKYGEVGLEEVAELLEDFESDDEESDTFDLFTQGVADRSGRVTQATVQKVISGMIEEVNDVTSND